GSQGSKPGDVIGQAGIESSYDTYLRGTAGSAQLTVDSRGRPTSAIEPKTTSRPGNTIRLTLDLTVQRAAEQALRYGIRVAHDNGQSAADGGAIVALDPRDGAALALASSPTYNPSGYLSRVPTTLPPLHTSNVAARNDV